MMTRLHSVRRRLPACLDAWLFDNKGAVMLVYAISGGMMITALSGALDAIDVGMEESRIQSAMDVANLSAAADLTHFATLTGSNLTQWQADVRAYYEANLAGGYLDPLETAGDITATVTGSASAGYTIHLSTSTKVNLLVPITMNTTTTTSSGGTKTTSSSANSITISAADTSVSIANSVLELVMVFDNSGSMNDSINGTTKMQGLKNAANTLVSDLLSSSSTTTSNARIGLVPFTSTVNVKNALPPTGAWLTPSYYSYNTSTVSAPADTSTSGWTGCAVEPRDSNGYLYPSAYSPTGTSKFGRYFYNVPPGGLVLRTYTSSGYGYGYGYGYGNNSSGRLCTGNVSQQTYKSVPITLSNGLANYCGYSGTAQGNGISYYFDQANYDQNGYSFSGESGTLTQNAYCIANPVTFLTNNTSTLSTAIKAMTANGATVIPAGILWGWRMLTSAWSIDNSAGAGWISSDTSYPKPETTQSLQRVMIVLTDGQNDAASTYTVPNIYNFNSLSGIGTDSLAAPTVTRSVDGKPMLSGLMDDNATSNGVAYSSDINDFQLAVCSAVKQAGITIYAITYGSVSPAGAATMKACATTGDYYPAPDATSLNTIFEQIAGHIGILRLTQ